MKEGVDADVANLRKRQIGVSMACERFCNLLFYILSENSLARYFDVERYSESELSTALDDSATEKKIDAMKRILAAVSVGHVASSLFPQVVENVSFSSLELKKAYVPPVQHAENNRDLAFSSITAFRGTWSTGASWRVHRRSGQWHHSEFFDYTVRCGSCQMLRLIACLT